MLLQPDNLNPISRVDSNPHFEAIQSVKDMMDQSSNSSSPMLVLNEVNSRLRKVQAENSGKQSPRPTEFNRTIVNNMFEGDKTTIMDQDQNSTLSRKQGVKINSLFFYLGNLFSLKKMAIRLMSAKIPLFWLLCTCNTYRCISAKNF